MKCIFFQAEDGIRDIGVTGVQACALPIWSVQCVAPERWRSVPDVVARGRRLGHLLRSRGPSPILRWAGPRGTPGELARQALQDPVSIADRAGTRRHTDRKSTRLNSSHANI